MSNLRRYLPLATAFGLALAGLTAAIVLVPYGDPAPGSDVNENGTVTAAFLQDLIALSDREDYRRPVGSTQISLPDDFGGHPDARSETWMIAAHLQDGNGHRIGVTFSLSRFGLRTETSAQARAPWDLRAFYRAHVTLVRDDGTGMLSEERFSRGGGVAGHDRAAGEVWLDHWQLSYGDRLTLDASVDGLPVNLSFDPVKAAQTVSSAETAPLQGFALPRIKVTGAIGAGDAETRVQGLAWMDRVWGALPATGGPLAHDRLILQLDDETDVSLFRTHRRDGRGSATVDGLIVKTGGDAKTLSGSLVAMTEAGDTRTRGTVAYPTSFRIEGGSLDLEVTPLTDGQDPDFLLPGWFGAVTVSGQHDGIEVEGMGTLQLTGYDGL